MPSVIPPLCATLNAQCAKKWLTPNLCIVLRFGFMSKLKETLRGLPRRQVEAIARRAGTTAGYLTEQLANGHRRPSIRLAKRLIEEIPGSLELKDLRPDIFEEGAA
jgi:hypothetical protein